MLTARQDGAPPAHALHRRRTRSLRSSGRRDAPTARRLHGTGPAIFRRGTSATGAAKARSIPPDRHQQPCASCLRSPQRPSHRCPGARRRAGPCRRATRRGPRYHQVLWSPGFMCTQKLNEKKEVFDTDMLLERYWKEIEGFKNASQRKRRTRSQ